MNRDLIIDPAAARMIRAPHAELAVLCGLMHFGRECAPLIKRTGLSAGDFYEPINADLYDACLYLINGPGPLPAGPVNLYSHCASTGLVRAHGRPQLPVRIADAWCTCYWDRDLAMYWHDALDAHPFTAGAAIACAEKVHQYAGRRATIYRAAYAARAALEGLPPDMIEG